MNFPKIKRDITEFLSNEDGRVSKESLIKLGVLSVGALGVSEVVSAETPCSYTCSDALESDAELSISFDIARVEEDMDMEMGDNCTSNLHSRLNEGWTRAPGTATVVISEHSENLASGWPQVIGFREDIVAHANSLTARSEDDSLWATHAHNVSPACEDVRIISEVTCSDDGTRANWNCHVEENGLWIVDEISGSIG